MLAYSYIPRLSNNVKIVVEKNNWGQIWYRNLDPVLKKRRLFNFIRIGRDRGEI